LIGEEVNMSETIQKRVRLKLVRSVIGVRQSHRGTILGLGLKKINSESYLLDTPQVRGMINKVSYLISVIDA
jgi:large subunit ribosomal protein L30